MPVDTAVSRPLSRRKKFLFTFVTLLLAIPLIELASWGALAFQRAGLPPVGKDIYFVSITGRNTNTGAGAETIHPYLGWVMNPQLSPGTNLFGRHIPVNSLGFNDEEQEIPRRRPDRVIIGIAGGSVAWQMSVAGEDVLRRALAESPALRGKEVRFVRLAMSGYKQPQQLMALSYLLALGAEFDAIINIDGYNELALNACENVDAGVFIGYPRMWNARMQDVVDPRNYSVSYQLLQLRAARQQLAKDRLQSSLAWSSTLDLIWCVRDRLLDERIVSLAEQLRETGRSDKPPFPYFGPGEEWDGKEFPFDRIIQLWKDCSLQMHRLCKINGIAYLQVLQPNQYLPGSKPMSEREREDTISDSQCYGQSITQGYPLMIAEGRALCDAGIDFHDLTMLFSTVEEPIYHDGFCHYNEKGNQLLAAAVAEKLLAAWPPTANSGTALPLPASQSAAP